MKGMRIVLRRDVSFQKYGIDRKRQMELSESCREGENAAEMRMAAYLVSVIAEIDIAEYILNSVQNKRSYDRIEKTCGRNLKRIPIGRTDFYGYRRCFYYLLDTLLRVKEEMENI